MASPSGNGGGGHHGFITTQPHEESVDLAKQGALVFICRDNYKLAWRIGTTMKAPSSLISQLSLDTQSRNVDVNVNHQILLILIQYIIKGRFEETGVDNYRLVGMREAATYFGVDILLMEIEERGPVQEILQPDVVLLDRLVFDCKDGNEAHWEIEPNKNPNSFRIQHLIGLKCRRAFCIYNASTLQALFYFLKHGSFESLDDPALEGMLEAATAFDTLDAERELLRIRVAEGPVQQQ